MSDRLWLSSHSRPIRCLLVAARFIRRHAGLGSRSWIIPQLRENPKTPLAKRRDPDSTERMIRPGFLDIESRQNLIELARDGLAAHRLARRANALVLLDDGMSCEAIAKVLLLDDDTIRTWYRLYEEDGIEGLTNFSYEGSACQLSGEQQEKLKAWVATALPRTTRQVGAWIENEFGVVYEGRSGLIALLHRLGLEYHKPNVIPRKLDEEKQKAFIEGYEKLLNSLGDDEAVLFADAVHPTHAARPVGCWAPSQEKLAIEQTSGRQRINIHGAIDLESTATVPPTKRGSRALREPIRAAANGGDPPPTHPPPSDPAPACPGTPQHRADFHAADGRRDDPDDTNRHPERVPSAELDLPFRRPRPVSADECVGCAHRACRTREPRLR